MHVALVTYINNQLNRKLSDEEVRLIGSTFKHKKLRKHQYLLQQGEICRIAGFIIKGALKQYTVDETGRENILGLFIENWWGGDRESFKNETPSDFFIEAFEETDMLVITKDDYLTNLHDQQFMRDLMHVLSEKQAMQLLKRVHVTKALSAEQRLQDFEKNYPALMQRFPQHMIASYLGMTKETMSRIRANAVKKSQ